MINFKELKEYALSGRSKEIGKLNRYWRFQYSPIHDTVKIYHRGYGTEKNDKDSATILFSILPNSDCKIHVDTGIIDSTFVSFAMRYLNLRFKLIPYAQREKYIGLEYLVNGYYYITDTVTINLYSGQAIEAPDYTTEEIDKGFNQLITNCSKNFRLEFTATYNLLNSSMTFEEMVTLGNPISTQELWNDLTAEKLSAQIIFNWIYETNNYKYRFQNIKTRIIDIRKLLQYFINLQRKLWAKQENKMVYTVHEQ